MKVEQRIKLLQEAHILDIVLNSRLIQDRLVASKRETAKGISKNIAKLMLSGKVNAALKLLTAECDSGVYEVNDEIVSELEEKHPKPTPIQYNTLLYS